MSNEKQQFYPERTRRILKIHHWIYSAIIALVLPAIVIAICGYRNLGEVIFLFGLCALLAWTIYWTNWVNSIVFAVGLPIFAITITGNRSILNAVILFVGCGLMVWSLWFWKLTKKRISEDFYKDKK